MSRKGVGRQVREESTYRVDLTKPVDLSIMAEEYNDNTNCFGKEWDMASKECPICADCEMCSIMFADHQKKQVAQLEKIHKYLDLADFSVLEQDDERIEYFLQGDRTVEEFFDWVSEESKCTDDVAVVEWIKRYIRSKPNIYTENGMVKFKNTENVKKRRLSGL